MAEPVVAQETPQYSAKVTEVLDKLSGFTLLEVSELVGAFEKKFGIQAAAAAPLAAAAAAPVAAAEEAVEPTSFKVMLKSFGDKKIQVIKAVRSVTSLDLKKAKEVVEGAPSAIKEGATKEEAEKCANVLKEAGGDVEVQAE
jgi:large subunit ribosomal protein L7/L12